MHWSIYLLEQVEITATEVSCITANRPFPTIVLLVCSVGEAHR